MGATTGDIADEERAGLQLRNWAQQGKTADDVYKDLGLHQIMGTFSKVEEFMKHPAYQKYNKYRDFLDKNDFRIWARQGKSPMDVFDKLGLHQILGTYKSYDDFMKHPTYKKFDNYRSFLWKFDYEKWAKQGKTADNVYDDLKIQVHGPKSKMFYDQYPDYRKYEGYRMYLKKSEEKAKEV
ncbi:hypothetical protein PHYBOEH_006789 [Phytophthora boehmeriae]|uniref:RxLR effector protein n=1 Tax=Phytophthora boehmeriae TaxID=109152 RepID=A0A8T1WD54_9STRA|nr:hypothetical protein PHYBOEH_006789 [Phytophthora boehmeriae]